MPTCPDSGPDKSYRIVDWQESDTVHINSLYNDPAIRPDAAGIPPRSEAQWNWEYCGPDDHAPGYVLARRDGRLVGTQGYIPIEFLLDGDLTLSGKDEDTLVHPEHRGRGVLDRMYERLFETAEKRGVRFLWGFTRTAIKPLHRNGYVDIGSFDAMHGELARLRPPGSRNRNARIEPMNVADPGCDAFSIDFAREIGGLTVHLTARYVQWRLIENPFREHIVFAARTAGRLVGLAAVKFVPNSRTAYLAELVAVNGPEHEREDRQSMLLEAVLNAASHRGCRWIEARHAGPHPYNRATRVLLQRAGMNSMPAESASRLLVRPIGGDCSACRDLKAWRISEILREY